MTTAQALNVLHSMTIDEIKDVLDLEVDIETIDLDADEIFTYALACLLDSDNL